MSSNPILNQTGPLYITDLRVVDNNTVHISGSEIINGNKTFNNKINTNEIENTGIITTTTLNSTTISNSGTITSNILNTGSILASNGKKYLRLLNLSNYDINTNNYISITLNNITSYTELVLPTIIKTSIINTFLNVSNNKYIFNEIGDYYININIIYSIDSTTINNYNINYSYDGIKSITEQDINILNLKYQNNMTNIYNVNAINTINLLLYISSSNNINLTIYKLYIDIIKLN